MNFLILSFFVLLLLPNQVSSHSQYGTDSSRGTNNIPKQIAPFFIPPPELAHDFGEFSFEILWWDCREDTDGLAETQARNTQNLARHHGGLAAVD
jgi:hypothetical protein